MSRLFAMITFGFVPVSAAKSVTCTWWVSSTLDGTIERRHGGGLVR